MSNVTLFTAAASVTITPMEIASIFAMPAYDAANLDLTVSNAGISPVSMGFGPGATAAGLTIPAGQTVLLTSSAATLAATVSNPLVVNAGPAPGNATSVNAVMNQRGGTITITRGTALSKPSF